MQPSFLRLFPPRQPFPRPSSSYRFQTQRNSVSAQWPRLSGNCEAKSIDRRTHTRTHSDMLASRLLSSDTGVPPQRKLCWAPSSLSQSELRVANPPEQLQPIRTLGCQPPSPPPPPSQLLQPMRTRAVNPPDLLQPIRTNK